MSKKKNKPNKVVDPQADMLVRFKSLLSPDDFSRLLIELQNPLSPCLRWNPLKTSPDNSFLNWVKRYDWQYEPVPFCPNGYWIKNASNPISKTVEHSLGHYYIQDAASMLPVELFHFDDTQEPLILDMAASPGGKTTHIISRTMDKGLVIANDSSRDRLTALRLVLQNWGASHAAISNYPGEYFGKWFPETFDYVLLDAPCSMQGLRETDAHALKPITQKEIDSLARRQINLLESAISALKVGGQVVYSTCTLTPEENEGVLDNILKLYGSAIQIETADEILHKSAAGITFYGELAFDPQVRNAVRLWPFNFGTAGFFAASIRKISTVPNKPKTAPDRPLSQAGWFMLDNSERKKLLNWVDQIYGIDLDQIMLENKLQIWQFKDSLHLFPEKFIKMFPNFPVQSLGIPLCEIFAEEYVLSHEFVTRFGKQAIKNVHFLKEDQLWSWMRGEDLTMPEQSDNISSTLIIKDDLERVFGIGKLTNNRLRNMLPKRVMIHSGLN